MRGPESTENFQTRLRARGTPAGSGTPPASFWRGLCRGRALCSCLDSVTAGAQRLQIVDAESSQRKGQDVVHQRGSGQPSALGTAPAQRLVGQHGVADAAPALVVTALVGGQAIVGKTVAPSLSAMGAAVVAHNAGAGPVRTSSIHGFASERHACAGPGAGRSACRFASEKSFDPQVPMRCPLPLSLSFTEGQ